jgi:hypothetical protein
MSHTAFRQSLACVSLLYQAPQDEKFQMRSDTCLDLHINEFCPALTACRREAVHFVAQDQFLGQAQVCLLVEAGFLHSTHKSMMC